MVFNIKIDVTELDDKSFSFKVEGTIPVAIQRVIASAITGIKTVAPEISKNIDEINKSAVKEKVKTYILEQPTKNDATMNISKAAADLNLTVDQVKDAYQTLVSEGFINTKQKENQ